MKRFLAIIFAFLMAIGFVGCAEYRYADSTNGGTNATKPDDTTTDNSGGDTTDDNLSGGNTTVTPEPTEEGVFSVTLYYNNEVFVPSEKIFAYWNDGQSINKAQFSSGVAKITGLDGDYQVTLSALPSGYTYDPNIYYATNDDKDIAVTLYKLNSASGKGTGFYDESITITRTGAYRVTISSPNQIVYFKYQPTVEGYYSIASMLDITANEINPVLIFYSSASSQNVSEYSKQIIDGGGVSNTYTKNFYHEVYRATGTETTIVFCITAESMTDAAFPIDIDFMLTRIGDYADDEIGEIVEPDSIEFLESLVGTEVLSPKGTFKYAAQIDPSLPNTLQSKYFALNPEDGFYHVYDKEKYADNNGYGPVLYAKLTQDCEVYVTGQDTYFNNAKPNQMFLSKVVGKATCSLHQLNGKNYIKFFYEMDYSDENNSKYRYKWAYRINNNGEETSVQIYFTSGYATPAVVDEYGQSDIANPTYKYLTKDGTFPVTEKIKQFLQDFAIASTLFRDGIGEAETGNSNSNSGKEIVKYTSDEDSQWLFACGYYE